MGQFRFSWNAEIESRDPSTYVKIRWLPDTFGDLFLHFPGMGVPRFVVEIFREDLKGTNFRRRDTF